MALLVVPSVASGGPVDIAGEGTTSSAISVPGLVPNDDAWNVVVSVSRAPSSSASGIQIPQFSVNVGTGSFTITNNTDDDGSGDTNNSTRRFYWRVFKSG
jgi:hypothetical protein